ncbi:MAG: DMT family protein [Bacteriovoracaceae bacterium]|nr:DMT family protein [Bacteriovoracaceae bacterium]
MIKSITLLLISNLFMTFAWYRHLKNLNTRPLWAVVFISWGIAFFEYCFQVPANRIGFQYLTLPQLKLIQECITLLVFVAFSIFYMNVKFNLNHLWAAACLLGAVYFVFK